MGPVIRALRVRLGWTQEQATAHCNIAGFDISRATYAQIETQLRNVTDLELAPLSAEPVMERSSTARIIGEIPKGAEENAVPRLAKPTRPPGSVLSARKTRLGNREITFQETAPISLSPFRKKRTIRCLSLPASDDPGEKPTGDILKTRMVFGGASVFRISGKPGHAWCLSDPTAISLDATKPAVLWYGTGANETSDNVPEFKIGENQDIVDLAVRVKTMKYRKIKLHVFPFRKNASSRNVPIPESNPGTSKDLENHLNTVLGYQVNLWFDVIYHQQEEYGFDPDNNGFVGQFDPEITSLYSHADYTVDEKDIRIFLLDSVEIRDFNNLEGDIYGGLAHPVGDMAIVTTGFSASNQPTHQQIREICGHEIVHIFDLYGHPDQEAGSAPLPGTDRTQRLMHSASALHPGKKLLVKKEWDKIEEWLTGKLNENQEE